MSLIWSMYCSIVGNSLTSTALEAGLAHRALIGVFSTLKGPAAAAGAGAVAGAGAAAGAWANAGAAASVARAASAAIVVVFMGSFPGVPITAPFEPGFSPLRKMTLASRFLFALQGASETP